MATESLVLDPSAPSVPLPDLLEGPQAVYPNWCGDQILDIFYNEIRPWLEGGEVSGFQCAGWRAARRTCRTWRNALGILPVVRVTTRSRVVSAGDTRPTPGQFGIAPWPNVTYATSERLICEAYCHIIQYVRVLDIKGVHLRYLKLTGAQFGDRQLIDLVNALVVHERPLSLDAVTFDDTGPVIGNLVPNLEHLILTLDTLTPYGVSAVACIVRACAKLRTLNLGPKEWDRDCREAIVSAAAVHGSLRDLTVANIGPFQGEYESILTLAANGLRSLTVRFDLFADHSTPLRIFDTIADSPTLDHVRLRCFNDLDIGRLVDVSRTQHQDGARPLKSLCIGLCRLSRAEFFELLDFLRMPSCQLQHVCLDLSTSTWSEVYEFFAIVKDHPTLRRVTVNAGHAGWTYFGECGKCITHILRGNRTPIHLILNSFGISYNFGPSYLQEEPRLQFDQGPCITW